MRRLALIAAVLALCSQAFALSAFIPGEPKKDKKKGAAPKLQPSGVSLTGAATPLTQRSSGGLVGPKEVLDQTAAPTSAGGTAGAPAASAASVDERTNSEATPVKKAPPRLRGR